MNMVWKTKAGTIDRDLEVEKKHTRTLRRELRQAKEKLNRQFEIDRRLNYDLNNKKMACDRVIAEQQARIQELIAQAAGRDDETIAHARIKDLEDQLEINK